jgi:hypothetical protein
MQRYQRDVTQASNSIVDQEKSWEDQVKRLENELKFKNEEVRQLQALKRERPPLQSLSMSTTSNHSQAKRFPSVETFHHQKAYAFPSSETAATPKPKATSHAAVNTEELALLEQPSNFKQEEPFLLLWRLLIHPQSSPIRHVRSDHSQFDPIIHPFHENAIIPACCESTGGFITFIPKICALFEQFTASSTFHPNRILYCVELLLLLSIPYPNVMNTTLEQPNFWPTTIQLFETLFSTHSGTNTDELRSYVLILVRHALYHDSKLQLEFLSSLPSHIPNLSPIVQKEALELLDICLDLSNVLVEATTSTLVTMLDTAHVELHSSLTGLVSKLVHISPSSINTALLNAMILFYCQYSDTASGKLVCSELVYFFEESEEIPAIEFEAYSRLLATLHDDSESPHSKALLELLV